MKKILLTAVLALPFFSLTSAFAAEGTVNNVNEEESLYKYNSLENRASFVELAQSFGNRGDYWGTNTNVDSEMGIEQQLEDLTQKQNFSVGEIEKAISNLENTDEVRSFLVGNNLTVLKFQQAQIKEIMVLLNALAEKTEDNKIKIQIDNQIKFLKGEQKKVEEFISRKNDEFSLFGWFVNTL